MTSLAPVRAKSGANAFWSKKLKPSFLLVTAENVLSSTPINIGFRRTLDGNKWDRWKHLLHRLILVQLTDHDDIFKWRLTTSGRFTVKSMYNDMLNGHTPYLKKYIWKMKVPLKIRIFMWFLHKKVILTKDNLVKRNWHGDVRCCFCDPDNTTLICFLSIYTHDLENHLYDF
jgi:hypothetical protein